MSENQPQDYSQLEALVIKALEHQDKIVTAKISFIEKAAEENEKVVAMLTQGYAELASMVESLVSVIVNKSDEDKQEFFETLAFSRKKMMDTLQHGMQIAEQNADRFTAHSSGANEESESDTATSES